MKTNETTPKKVTQQPKTSTRGKIGLYLIGLGFISPAFALIVPLLGLSSNSSTWLITFFLVGAPEIFLILGAMLAGKEGVRIVKGKFMELFRKVFKRRPKSEAVKRTGTITNPKTQVYPS